MVSTKPLDIARQIDDIETNARPAILLDQGKIGRDFFEAQCKKMLKKLILLENPDESWRRFG